jgi:hypothetical protein
MWIKNFQQFLNHTLERIGKWATGLEFLPARLIGRASPWEILSQRSWFGSRKVQSIPTPTTAYQHLHVTYSYRSLHCHMQVQILESTPGMQFIHRALQRSHEA